MKTLISFRQSEADWQKKPIEQEKKKKNLAAG